MNDGKTIFVTGASGHLGRRLIPKLISRGYRIKGQCRNLRKAEKYLPPEVAMVVGDIRDKSWMPEALAGSDYLIHSAAMVSLRPVDRREMESINVDGTKNLVEAARKAAVRRLLHISSVATVGGSVEGAPLDETATFNLAGYGLPYFETKRAAEEIVMAASGSVMDTVVVNPSIILYPPERKITGNDLKKIPRFIPCYFDFGLNLVHADDVIDGIISALEHGRSGERYILAGDNIDAPRLFAVARKSFGIKKPWLKIPISCLYPLGLAGEMLYRLRHIGSPYGKGPRVNRGIARLANLRFFYDITKARKELAYSPRTIEEFLQELLADID